MTEAVPVKLVPGKTDAQAAEEIKATVSAALAPVCKAIDEARAMGFEVNFSSGPDWQGKSIIKSLDIFKQF